MLKAIEKKTGNLMIPALLTAREREQWKKEKSFFCPDCKQSVLFKNGARVTPHFAHYAASACSNRDGGEGEYHLRGKLQLYQWLVNQRIAVELEAYLPEIQQRPDLLVTIQQKRIAFEYQCASLSPRVFKKRTESYVSAGITPIWILGGNRQRRTGTNALWLNAADIFFLHQYRSDYTPLLYYYCSNTKQFCFFHHIYFTGRKVNYGTLHYIALKNLPFLTLFRYDQLKNWRFPEEWLIEKKKLRLLVSSVYHSSMQEWLHWLYENGCHPGTLPNFIGLPVPSQYMLEKHPAVWQSELLFRYLLPLPVGEALNSNLCRKLLASSFISIPNPSWISPESCPVEEFFRFLTLIGIFTKKEGFVYIKRKEIAFPDNIEKALRTDQELYHKLASRKVLSF